MKRVTLLLVGVGLALVVVLWFVLYLQPAREQVTDLEAQRQTVEATQQQLRTEIARLQEVRSGAPEQDALLTQRRVLVPDEPGLPAILRQLQLAADDAGVVLSTVATSRPTPLVPGEDPALQDLSSIQLTLAVQGRYFQLIDLLRRIEDPGLTGRGMQVETLSLSEDEYPVLNASVTVRAFALTRPAIAPEPLEDPAQDTADGEDGAGDGGDDAGEEQPGPDDPADAEGEEP